MASCLSVHKPRAKHGKRKGDKDTPDMPSAVDKYSLSDFRQVTAARQEIAPVNDPAVNGISSEVYGKNKKNSKVNDTKNKDKSKHAAVHLMHLAGLY